MSFFFEEDEIYTDEQLDNKIKSTTELSEWVNLGVNASVGLMPLGYIMNDNSIPWILILIALDLRVIEYSLENDLTRYYDQKLILHYQNKSDDECYKILSRNKVNFDFGLYSIMKLASLILTVISLNYMLNFNYEKIVLYIASIVSTVMMNSVANDLRVNYKKNSSINKYCKNRLGLKHKIINRKKFNVKKFIKKYSNKLRMI